MRLLIVDDEVLAADGLKYLIDWKQLNITRIYTANSALEAKRIIQKENIDIVISDIEMPVEDGLSLIKWMRNENCPIENIFLTCHEDFKYAREALVLGSSDYLLKPVEPEDLIKAVKSSQSKLNHRKKTEADRLYAESMKKNKEILDHIWYCNLVKGKLGNSKPEIIRQCREHNISLETDEKLMFIYFVIKKVEEPFRSWETQVYDFVFTNVANECLELKPSEKVFSYTGANRHSDTYGAIVSEHYHTVGDITKACKRFIHWMKKEYGTLISCYLDDFTWIDQLDKQSEKLCRIDEGNQWEEALVLICRDEQEPVPYKNHNLKLWEILWKEGKTELLLEKIRTMLETYLSQGILTPRIMEQERKDFNSIAFKMMQKNGFETNLLWQQEEFCDLFRQAHKSIDNAMKLFVYLTEKEREVRKEESREDHGSIVEQVKSYIAQNISEEITRTKLSEHVHLNRDYLNRLFKRETGKSLSEYIIEEKMKVAKELLIMTDMPVGDIGFWIGYSNFSYFSSYFKKITGYSAAAYRHKFRKET